MYTIAYDCLECTCNIESANLSIILQQDNLKNKGGFYTDLNFTFVVAFVTFQRRIWLLFELQNGRWNL